MPPETYIIWTLGRVSVIKGNRQRTYWNQTFESNVRLARWANNQKILGRMQIKANYDGWAAYSI